MSYKSLYLLNKIGVIIPLVLLEGCDGSRGREMSVALGATFLLAVSLSALEPFYNHATTTWNAIKIASLCTLIVILVFFCELFVFLKIGKLQGPIGEYGIANVTLFTSILLSIFTTVCVWSDHPKKVK